MKDTSFNPEYLNAYVDDELKADAREAALARLESDPDFKRSVCEVRTLKELVRGAYGEAPSVRESRIGCPPPIWRQALVAGLVLVLGLAGGWFAHDGTAGPAPLHVAGLPAGYVPVSLSSQVDPNKIVLHLDSGDPAHLQKVLTLVEDLLHRRGDKVHIEVVVNSYGLDLLREDVSPYKGVIERLSHDHANLAFMACNQTIARLQREGTKVVLVPGVGTAAPSAINEILYRMQQGWVYVKV